MKKTTVVILFLCIGGLLIVGWIAGRVTGVFSFYKFATDSNAPTYYHGNLLFTSNLKTPDYGNFVCFRNQETKGSVYIFRLIGKPRDVIEIKDAVVYRNGKKLDEPYTWNEYVLSKKEYMGIRGYIERNGNHTDVPTPDSISVARFTDAEYKQYHLTAKKYTSPKGINDEMMSFEFRRRRFSVDNFGPVTIPAGNYFLLGDNRHDAQDSRYLGFIKAGDIVATKIGY